MTDEFEFDPFRFMIGFIATLILIVPILPILLALLQELSRTLWPTFLSLVPAVLAVLKVGVVAVGILAAYNLIDAAKSSPYPVPSIGVNGRVLPVEAVDLGHHDDAECLTCGRDDGPGVRRGYVESYTVFGLPVREVDRSETYDCAAHTGRDGLDALNHDLEDDDRDALDLVLEQTNDDQDGDQA